MSAKILQVVLGPKAKTNFEYTPNQPPNPDVVPPPPPLKTEPKVVSSNRDFSAFLQNLGLRGGDEILFSILFASWPAMVAKLIFILKCVL
jgi:hypothetical protein